MTRIRGQDRGDSTAPFSLHLSRLLSDTWVWEIVSIVLSGIFLALIIIILKIHNGKEVPQLAYGITLNAIISTLATFSKSSLLVAVAAFISQLKWHWYRNSDGKRLFDMQLFDDASRGPLGAIQILARVSRWPFLSVGAVVFVLVAAFDPFIQQVIAYSTQTMASNSPSSQPSNTFRAENFIARHKANDPTVDVDDLLQLVAASLWDFQSNQAGVPDVHCPTVLGKRYGSWAFDATGFRYRDGKLHNATDGLPFTESLNPSWSHIGGQNGQYFNLANTTSHYDFNSPYSIKYEDLYPLYSLDGLLNGEIPVTDSFKHVKGNSYINSTALQFKEEYFHLRSFQRSSGMMFKGAEHLNLRQIMKRGGLTKALPQVASGINKYIREKGGTAVPGQSYTLVVLVNVRWG
ncbi:hypothetical protein F4808DRAFT_466041 [Astrocystis sublimbata]|nr:hypothetical protein F4808DRAFT_466041 [Astrocystis sublimbata]